MQTPSQTRPIDAVLLDMDGTILNSIKAAERIWAAWAKQHGIDVETFLPTIHGVRSVETVRRAGIAGLDPVAEAAAITQAEIYEVEGIEEIAGAAAFLAALPTARWGIVTSAPCALALRRIEAAGLAVPPFLIAAEDVAHGKPEPDCFHLGAERLGTTADRCLVIEDSAAGIAAAVSAGATVLVVTATHHKPVETEHPAIVDYRDLTLDRLPNGALLIGGALGVASPSGVMNWLLQAGPV